MYYDGEEYEEEEEEEGANIGLIVGVVVGVIVVGVIVGIILYKFVCKKAASTAIHQESGSFNQQNSWQENNHNNQISFSNNETGLNNIKANYN